MINPQVQFRLSQHVLDMFNAVLESLRKQGVEVDLGEASAASMLFFARIGPKSQGLLLKALRNVDIDVALDPNYGQPVTDAKRLFEFSGPATKPPQSPSEEKKALDKAKEIGARDRPSPPGRRRRAK